MMPSNIIKLFEHLKIGLEAIKSATNSFADECCIGKGGFGKVYKGALLHSKGFCDEWNEKILVYEYAPKGSLDMYLNCDDLTWIPRLRICIGAARGLAYLHEPGGTQQRVLHRDIKSSNILLDENWNARISDLGLSKFGPANQQYTFLVSHAVGTIGYCDPLYVETGLLTKESDVYSFGVVLFEILCGRLSISNNHDRHRPLTGLVREYYEENKINEIIYSKIRHEIVPESLEAFTTIAYQCLNTNCKKRPLMTQVLCMLENALEYQELCVPRIVDYSMTEIIDSSDLRALRLPDLMATNKVMQLIYTYPGSGLIVHDSSDIYKLWKWQQKSTTSIVPLLWNVDLMTNDLNECKPKLKLAGESKSCIALSKNNSYFFSASGGKVSVFNMMTFKVMTTLMRPPPAATYLAIHPHDNNIIAIGKEDSTIDIYHLQHDEVKIRLNGHQKQITGLAFSQALNSLVSSGADAQLCMWNINRWEKLTSRSLQSPPGYPYPLVGDTKIQYHDDQRHLLVVHESHFAIYDHQLKCLKLWLPRDNLPAPISSGTYSCDGLLIFTGFSDGAVGVFDAQSLRLRYSISPSAYISSLIYSSNTTAYPRVIAAHPSDPKQFALGMSDGSVHVIELTNADQMLSNFYWNLESPSVEFPLPDGFDVFSKLV